MTRKITYHDNYTYLIQTKRKGTLLQVNRVMHEDENPVTVYASKGECMENDMQTIQAEGLEGFLDQLAAEGIELG